MNVSSTAPFSFPAKFHGRLSARLRLSTARLIRLATPLHAFSRTADSFIFTAGASNRAVETVSRAGKAVSRTASWPGRTLRASSRAGFSFSRTDFTPQRPVNHPHQPT